MGKNFGWRPKLAGLTVIATAAAILLIAPSAFANAVNTSDDPGLTGAGVLGSPAACLNGQPGHTDPAVNCNIYDLKTDVFLSGSPDSAALSDGNYFFAILSPGGQPNPNDGTGSGNMGTPKNLSDDYDAWTNREFSLTGGTIAMLNGSSHFYDAVHNEVQAAPFSDTLNNGGVYILAVCKVPATPTTGNGAPGVDPRICKYDAFKVNESQTSTASDLTVIKDATGSFDRKFTWDEAKSVDKTLVQQVGGNATFNYTVTVTPTGHTDGSYQVTGTIQVFNPNSFAVTGVNISDAISYDDDNDVATDPVADPNASCAVTNGASQSVPANDSISRDYTCTYSPDSPAATDELNTATATWAAQGDLLAGNADWTVGFSFPSDPTTLTDECVTANDAVDGGSATNLATLCVDKDGALQDATSVATGVTVTKKPTIGTPTYYELTYSRSFAVPATGCLTHTNTADFATNDSVPAATDGTLGDNSVTVTVCGPANNSALTIGFWKGPNGNSLIQNYCSWNTPSLASYLSGLGGGSGPFSDAAGKTCSQLVTYVNNIIKGANATNMNTMLKAQMLATALDVYFSGTGYRTTSLNGAKPPSTFLTHGPLGGFNMDMTAICPMVDNTTTGTASCKNNTPSTNAFASGAVPSAAMTVQAILTFAATSPAPFSGGVWYAGNRTKQEILKNIFDQINNNDAFGAI
jgi:hypothetical protein